jgi:hypothetical protein
LAAKGGTGGTGGNFTVPDFMGLIEREDDCQ